MNPKGEAAEEGGEEEVLASMGGRGAPPPLRPLGGRFLENWTGSVAGLSALRAPSQEVTQHPASREGGAKSGLTSSLRSQGVWEPGV